MKIKIKLITSILSALLLTSCVDNVMSDAPDKDNPPTGTLMFHLHTYLEDQEVDFHFQHRHVIKIFPLYFYY